MSETSNHARTAAMRVVQRLQEAGYMAYLAGGCVRDTLLGRWPKDYDVATDAKPPQVKVLFRDARLVGEAFGVLLVPRHEAGHRFMVEVATFRTDGQYTDGRRPTEVRFTDARQDAARRDFTINGLFENPLVPDGHDPIIDYVDGRVDLGRGVVRAIGDPEQRFGEDYLRMLRAVRFAARFQFQIEEATRAAIVRHAFRLSQISAERIGQESKAMLSPGDDSRPHKAIQLIQALHLDDTLLGEDHAEVPTPTVKGLPLEANYPTVLAAWILDRRAADQGDDACRKLDPVHSAAPLRARLCLSNDQHGGLTTVLALVRRVMAWPTLPVAQRKRLMADRYWPQALMLLRAHLGPIDAPLRDRIDADAALLAATELAPDPFVHGGDLIAMDIKPGPALGRLLTDVYDAQLEGEVRNREEALAWLRRQV